MALETVDKVIVGALAVGLAGAIGYTWNQSRYPGSVSPIIRPGLDAFEGRYGRPKAILGGGVFGQAFDMGDDLVMKITAAPGEAEAVRRVIKLRKSGHELRGFVPYVGKPALLGKFPLGWRLDPEKFKEPLYAIGAERVDPLGTLKIALVNGRTERPRTNPSEGTPFQFASETAQSWAERSPTKRAKLLKEYRHWVRVIRAIDGFDDVGASLEEFLDLTGIPLWDVRPENCGRILRGDRRIVCFDIMIPERGDGSLASKPRPAMR